MKLNVVDNYNEVISQEALDKAVKDIHSMYDELKHTNKMNFILSMVFSVTGLSVLGGYLVYLSKKPYMFGVALLFLVMLSVYSIYNYVSKLRDIEINQEIDTDEYLRPSEVKQLHDFYMKNGELQLDHFNGRDVVLVGRNASSLRLDSRVVDIVIGDFPVSGATLKFDNAGVSLHIK